MPVWRLDFEVKVKVTWSEKHFGNFEDNAFIHLDYRQRLRWNIAVDEPLGIV